MLRNSASRILSGSRQSWQRSISIPASGSNSYYHSSTRASGILSHLYSTNVFTHRREERRNNSSASGLPRMISVVDRRNFSTTEEHHSATLREKMQEQRDRGRAAASKGAHSLREMVQKYGAVFVGTYASVYFATLGSFYVGIESGVLDPAYVMSWVSNEPDAKSTVHVVMDVMDHYAWTRPYVPIIESNPQVANLAVAWIAVKFTEPIRLGTTLAIVPRLSRYLGYAPPKEDHDHVDEVAKEEPVETKGETTEKETSAKKV